MTNRPRPSRIALNGVPATPRALGGALGPGVALAVLWGSVATRLRHWVRLGLGRIRGRPMSVTAAGAYHLVGGAPNRRRVPLPLLMDGVDQRLDTPYTRRRARAAGARSPVVVVAERGELATQAVRSLTRAGHTVSVLVHDEAGPPGDLDSLCDGLYGLASGGTPAAALAAALLDVGDATGAATVLVAQPGVPAGQGASGQGAVDALAGSRLSVGALTSVDGRDLRSGALAEVLFAVRDGASDLRTVSDLVGVLTTACPPPISVAGDVSDRVRQFEAQSGRPLAPAASVATGLTGLKVSFIGPWNFDSGLAAAARSYAGALLLSGARVNIAPIDGVAFGPHRPMPGASGITSFHGPADVAITSVSPESWRDFLRDKDLAGLMTARYRIGAFIWEGERLPREFAEACGWLDEIWAPSDFVRDCFAHSLNLPCRVVPYSLAQPSASGEEARERVRRKLGLGPERKVVLYAFDAASFVMRKNPASLVRAFRASGIGAEGWTLVLKTKNAGKRDPDIAELRRLASGVEDCLLFEENLGPGEMDAMMDLADMYVSPHASEGFGLGIAEALMRGTPTVATDFGGSRDFLHHETGYPVPARPFCLTERIGPYLPGTTWAMIDEDELAATMRTIAATGADARRPGAATAIRNRYNTDSIAGTVAGELARISSRLGSR